MKPAFTNIASEKQRRVMEASVDEFGLHGYWSGSTDRIIRKARISKGGLYEYISSKRELYLAAVTFAYDEIYGYLHEQIDAVHRPLPDELTERLRQVNEYAAEAYLRHPNCVALLAGAAAEREEELGSEVESLFEERFDSLFGDVDLTASPHPGERIFELVRMLLVKTRNEFLCAYDNHVSDGSGTQAAAAAEYLEAWEFYLQVLKQGIYTHS